ncbi:MAG: suppressor of fused domain protein, partial [Clostridia bacterium]|nr:suppressor of fused domain protein [Clostridia bacterium]
VHTDVFSATDGEMTVFYTVGMSAREMAAPSNCPKRVELMMTVRGEMKPEDPRSWIIASQLQSVSKLPFKQDTWLGDLHTVDAFDRLEKEFGYSAFLFLTPSDPCNLDGEEISFLEMIPLYADEYQWIVEKNGGSREFALQLLLKIVEGYEYCINEDREHIYPRVEDDDEGI